MDVIKNTLKLLSLASEYGYKRIAIGIRHKDIPKSVSFPFEPDRIVFGWPCDKTTTSGGTWPAIWKIIEKLGAGAGCGNSHQMQIKSEMFLDGYYYLDKDNTWKATHIWKKSSPKYKEVGFPLSNIVSDRDLCIKMYDTKDCKDTCVCKTCMNREKKVSVKKILNGDKYHSFDDGYCSHSVYYGKNKRNFFIKKHLGCINTNDCKFYTDWIKYLRKELK